MAFSFNLSYLMLAFLIPLEALHLGASVVWIGLLAALPSILQVPLRSISGALCDTWGERLWLQLAFVCGMLAGLVLVLFPMTLSSLVLAQLAVGTARGLFWVPMQTYAARSPGDAAGSLGRLASANNVGALCGILFAGPLTLAWGYEGAFAVTAVLAAVALAVACGLPASPPTARRRGFGDSLRALPLALRHPIIRLAGWVSALSAVPQALVQSFYPVYLTHLGQGPVVASAITSLRSGGMILAGLMAAWTFRRLGWRRSCAGAVALMAGGLLITAAGGQLALVALGVLAAGVASGLASVLGQVIAAECGGETERNANLALVNVFFSVGMLAVPLGFGVLAAHIGLAPTFLVLGGLVAACTVWLGGGRQAAWRQAGGVLRAAVRGS